MDPPPRGCSAAQVARLAGACGRGAGRHARRLSLAAALAIPFRLANGSSFPDRDLVIMVAAAVIVASLLMQGTSLPRLLRRLGLRAEDFRTEENEARLEAARAALAWLDDHSGADGADDATESLRALYEARVRRLQIIPPSDQGSGDVEKMERYLTLRLELLGVERSVVLSLRREGPHQRDTVAHHRTRRRPRGGQAHRLLSVAARFCLPVVEPEADLQRHLEVRNSPLFEMTAHRLHFEPVESACRLGCSGQPAADSRVDAVG